MRVHQFALSQILVMCVVGMAFGQETESDFAKLQGTWKGTSPEGASLNLTVDGNTFKSLVKVKSSAKGRGGSYVVEQDFTMDEFSSPKEIDFHVVDESGDLKIVKAIYKLKADKLTICMDSTGKKRPTKFAGGSEGGSMVVYNRYPQSTKSGPPDVPSRITSNSRAR